MIILMFILTIAAVTGVVYLASIVWSIFFVASMPTAISGLMGGIAALPIWESLKAVRRQNPPTDSTLPRAK